MSLCPEAWSKCGELPPSARVELPGCGGGGRTRHPSWLLRIEEEADKRREYRNFVADLRQPAKNPGASSGLTR